jgi:hypothetical protein
MRVFRAGDERIPKTEDWLADDPVSSELLSTVNSLLNREITGNFADFSLREAGPRAEKASVCLRYFHEFPTQQNREF